LLFACACGLKDIAFLYAVPEDRITVDGFQKVDINLPGADSTESLYFTHFVFFYRIYISGGSDPFTAITIAEQMEPINPALASDFRGLYPFTSSNISNTTVNTSASLFTSRRYYSLDLEGYAAESFFDTASQGQKLTIDFSVSPSLLRLGSGSNIKLLRSSGVSSPQPNRYFQNHQDLYDPSKATSTINADTATHASPLSSTYVALYIAKMGRDANTLSSIYSVPTFVGVFKLPN
jgi:hypothetical protein